MEGQAGYNMGEDKCMYMLNCIYVLVQTPRQYYMLCREVHQEAGLKQLQTDKCVCICYVSNIIRQQQLPQEDLLIKGKFLNMDAVPEKMRVWKSCRPPVAAMIVYRSCCRPVAAMGNLKLKDAGKWDDQQVFI